MRCMHRRPRRQWTRRRPKLIAAVPGLYVSAFADVGEGRNGSCGATCDAVAGDDLPPGRSTPNVANLLGLLADF